MTKIDNITNSLMTNPLVCVVIALFVLLIILGIIRLLNPGFSVGAEVKGHFGSLNGGMRIEGFEDPPKDPYDGESDGEGDTFIGTGDEAPGAPGDLETESFTNQY